MIADKAANCVCYSVHRNYNNAWDNTAGFQIPKTHLAINSRNVDASGETKMNEPNIWFKFANLKNPLSNLFFHQRSAASNC